MNKVIEKVNEIIKNEKNVEAPKPPRHEILSIDPESPFGVENLKFEDDKENFNISVDSEGRLTAGTITKICEIITSHTPLPERKDAYQVN